MSLYTDEALRALIIDVQKLVKEATWLIRLERESRLAGTKEKE